MTTGIASPAIFCLSSSSFCRERVSASHSHLPFSRSAFFTPNFSFKQNPRISQNVETFVKHRLVVPCCCSSDPGINPETTDESSKESSVSIKLPRRSLLVQFTCNACGERTKRLINRLAYERGTVFVQCSGCLQHHKLVDNLGLVVEYDFRTDTMED